MYSFLRDTPTLQPEKIELINPTIPYRDHVLATINFTLLGLLSAYPWNTVPDIINTVMYELYDIDEVDSLFKVPIVINELIILGIIAYYSHSGGVRPVMLKWTCFIFGAIIFIIPFVVQFFSQKSFMIKLLVFWLGLRFALYMGIIFTLGSSIAATLPVNYNGLISLGSGISGLVSFILFLLADRVIWPRYGDDVKDETNLLKTTWFLFGIATVICIIGGIMFTTLMTRDWFKDRIRTFWSSPEEIAIMNFGEPEHDKSSAYELDEDFEVLSVFEFQGNESDAMKLDKEGKSFDTFELIRELPIELQQSRSPLYILKDCWKHIFSGSLTLWVTLFLFPLVGPYSWNDTNLIDIYICIFLVSDLTGRYIAYCMKPGRIIMSRLIELSVIRIILIPLYTLPLFLENTIFNTIPYQTIISLLLSASNGFIMTLCMICAPESLKRIKEKGRIGTYIILLFHISVILGFYSSRLYIMAIGYYLSKT